MRTLLLAVVAFAALAASSAALAGGMHPTLAARLSGMGEHGIVNFTAHVTKGKLCWNFDVPTKGITSASIRDTHGMVVAHLGMHYQAKACGTVPKRALGLIESAPAKYVVWVDTKGHPGDLRGKLFAGMAHM